MGFIADKQTLGDLNLLDRYGSSSIFALFDQTRTKGGQVLLEKMFRHPLTDVASISRRSSLFKYFQGLDLVFPVNVEELTIMERSLHSIQQRNWLSSIGQTVRRQSLRLLGLHEEYDLFIQGLQITSSIMSRLNIFLNDLLKKDPGSPFEDSIRHFQALYNDPRIEKVHSVRQNARISFGRQVKCSHLLGNVFYQRMFDVLNMLYELDVYISVSTVARLHRFSYANALPAEEQVLHIKNCRYPVLKNAQGNDIRLDSDGNILFLTGANMAGKSTLMKSIGVAVYLAHMGFPITADRMEFSIRDGIFSSINLPDDISQGYSHFYAEVLRVKTVAEAVGSSKKLLVIFDELFKGTNVKDAFDATLSVTKAFAAYRNCAFIISTHILEVADELGKDHPNIIFSQMPTVMDGRTPTYTYILQDGVSADRHGMMIIENEGILDMMV